MNPLLAIATALLLILAFPRFDLHWLAPVALAPLLITCAREPRPARRFLLGWACGFVYWFGVCYWIQFVLEFHGGMIAAAAWGAFLLFCAAKALHMAVFALLAGILMRGWWAMPAVSALWVALEVTHGSLGFAWLALGNAGADMGIPLRLAPHTGVYGISFIFAMMSAAVALPLLRRPRPHLLWLLALPFLIFLPLLPGPARATRTAVLVQPNLSQSEEWTEQSVERMKQRLALLSLKGATGLNPALIAWPEVPAPLYFEDPQLRELMQQLAGATRASVLAGVVAHDADGAPFNSAMLVSPKGEVVSRYDKVNLVPFGEFVPWPFDFINKISTEAGDFRAGSRVVVSDAGDHKLGTFICYESVFPRFVRQFAAQGAEVLFNISNDGWFARSNARFQHLLIVRMRAVENRRWILRATNDGITATIDPAGRLRGRVDPYKESVTRTGFSWISEQTLYTQYGDWFPLLCAVAAAAALVLSRGGLRARPRP